MSLLQKSRVSVDFPIHERDVLEELCEQDIRPAQEQLRWLVLSEAKRRGLQPHKKMNNGDASVSRAERVAIGS